MKNVAEDKENMDPYPHKSRGLGANDSFNSLNTGYQSRSGGKPLSPGASKRKRGQLEQRETRAPLRDITTMPGLAPTLAQPAFHIASDTAALPQDGVHRASCRPTATSASVTAHKKKSSKGNRAMKDTGNKGHYNGQKHDKDRNTELKSNSNPPTESLPDSFARPLR
jgi:hypothetical protein